MFIDTWEKIKELIEYSVLTSEAKMLIWTVPPLGLNLKLNLYILFKA